MAMNNLIKNTELAVNATYNSYHNADDNGRKN